jgi:hypothetical protein
MGRMRPIKRAIAGCLVAAVLAMTMSAGTSAKPRDRSFTVDPGVVVQNLTGPTTVVVLGNPFRYPWMLSINQQTVNAPPIPTQIGPTVTPATGAVQGAGNPVPGASPQPLTNAPASTQTVAAPATTTNGAIVVPLLRSPGGTAVTVSACPTKAFDAVEHCILAIQNRVRATTRRTFRRRTGASVPRKSNTWRFRLEPTP